jgi:membrane dipeptidase
VPRHRPLATSLVLALQLGAATAADAADVEAQARALHAEAIVVDTHVDTTPFFEDPQWRFDERHDAGHVDLPRLREGGVDAVFWSIYLGPTEGQGRAIREAVLRMDAVHELVRRHPDALELVTTAQGIRDAATRGRIACLMGVEGGHIIEESLPALRTFYRLGARYLTLTHSFHTGWADSSGTNEVPEPVHAGLTPFGEDVVREMNRLGMLVDVSHVSDDTFRDVLRVSRAPVIASHSSARAIADHPRNLSDAMLQALAENGGAVMINFYSGYVDAALVAPIRQVFRDLGPSIAALRERHAGDPHGRRRAFRELMRGQTIPQTSIDVVLDHIDHALRVAGPEHVGIGADWDGVASMPRGLDDVSRLPALTEGLLARGHGPEVVRGVLGANLLRVMEAVEGFAEPSR